MHAKRKMATSVLLKLIFISLNCVKMNFENWNYVNGKQSLETQFKM